MKVKIAIAVLLCLGIAFLVTDCAVGVTRYHEARIVMHNHIASWVETQVTSDDEGAHTSVYVHPEEWHLICKEAGGDLEFDCDVSAGDYAILQDETIVTVKTRQGRFTGYQWLPRIDK